MLAYCKSKIRFLALGMGVQVACVSDVYGLDMKNTILILAVGVLSLVAEQRAHAALLLGTYTFPGSDVQSPPSGDYVVPTYANMTFGQFTRTTDLTYKNVAEEYSSSSYGKSSTINLNQYVQFTLTPSTGYRLSVASISFDSYIGANGPASGQVSIFLGTNPANNATPLASQSYSPTTTKGSTTFNPATTFTDQGFTIRFYGWNAGNNGNDTSFTLDNVAINGMVPEPVNVALGIFAGVFVLTGLVRTERVRRLFCWA
jgi:hypothetical protein